jgi:hypothetical protein
VRDAEAANCSVCWSSWPASVTLQLSSTSLPLPPSHQATMHTFLHVLEQSAKGRFALRWIYPGNPEAFDVDRSRGSPPIPRVLRDIVRLQGFFKFEGLLFVIPAGGLKKTPPSPFPTPLIIPLVPFFLYPYRGWVTSPVTP